MAYSVKTLAKKWECSPKHIYNLIDRGDLDAFDIGKRGKRISEEEVEKCERKQKSLTGAATSPSDDQVTIGLPTSIM